MTFEEKIKQYYPPKEYSVGLLTSTEEEFIKAWMFAKEVRKRYTILNKINLQPEIFRQMYEMLVKECK